MNATTVRLLAFDFGLKRIGVATGQTLTGTTQMLAPLPARDGIPDWLAIEKLLKEWQPDLLLIGIPLAMDGSDLSVTPNARKFMNRLHGRFGLPVQAVDERATSKEARQQLFEYGGYKTLQHQSVDSLAAELMLQQWLHERQRSQDAADSDGAS